jgi:hypothetical protein
MTLWAVSVIALPRIWSMSERRRSFASEPFDDRSRVHLRRRISFFGAMIGQRTATGRLEIIARTTSTNMNQCDTSATLGIQIVFGFSQVEIGQFSLDDLIAIKSNGLRTIRERD